MSLLTSIVILVSFSPQGVPASGVLAPATSASTLAWKDFDRDGREDVYVVRFGFADRLLRNLGDGSFEEVGAELGLPTSFSRSAAWGDFDGDGWADLFLTARLGGVRLFRNQRDGRFEERTREAGLIGLAGGRDARALDYDDDGRLDVALEGPGDALLLHNLGDGRFAAVNLGAPRPAALAVLLPSGEVLPLSASTPNPLRLAGAELDLRTPVASAPAAGELAEPGSQNFVASTPNRASISVSGPVPSGYMILGDTLVAPAGYTSTGIIVKPDNWHFRAPMAIARFGPAAAAVSGKVYVIGGQDIGGVILSVVEEYDPVTDTWAFKASMPTPRALLTAAAVGGKIYAIGGLDNAGSLATVEEFDPAANTWTPRAPMSSVRSYLSAAVFNGKIYAIGGFDGTTVVSTVAEYDPVANAWTPRASLPAVRYIGQAATLNGKVYWTGGQDLGSPRNTVYRYDPGTDTWTLQGDLREARSFSGGAVANGKLYAFGGLQGGGLVSVEEYEPTVLYAHRKN